MAKTYQKLEEDMLLVHPRDQLVDLLFTVAPITTTNLAISVALALEATPWCRELEWPQEVGDLLEVWANSVDLMHKVFHPMDTELAKIVGNDLVVVERNPALVHFAITTLVDQLANSLQGWEAIGHIWLHVLEHLQDGLVDLQEHTIV